MCDFIFEHRERQRKKHFCLLRCLSAFATPIKLYFRCVFKLLPYVALALSVAVFLWKNRRRKFAWRKRLASFESYEAHLESGDQLSMSTSEETPENQVLKKETVELVRNLVSELPEKYRTSIYLFYSADMKIAEIADCLKISENTVKSRLRKAKSILKKKLEVADYER